jgi:transposase
MTIPVTPPKALLVNMGYDGDAYRQNLLMHRSLPIIPPYSNLKAPEHADYRRNRNGNRIKRMFGKLKQQRRFAARYDKTDLSFASFLDPAAVRLSLKPFVNAA